MTRRVLVVSLMMAVFLGIGKVRQTLGSDDAAQAEQEILKLEGEEKQAIMGKDTVTLNRLYAEGLAWLGRGELLTKAQVISDFGSGTLRNNSFVHDQLHVKVYGDTAVLTGHSTSELVFHGKVLGGPKRFTDVWVKIDGRWQLVAHSVIDAKE
jgi:hypothetical protein